LQGSHTGRLSGDTIVDYLFRKSVPGHVDHHARNATIES